MSPGPVRGRPGESGAATAARPPVATSPLFTALVDDAGLFPPTALPMSDALARHRADEEAAGPVLTHRFLCPASRLDELRARLSGPIRLGLILDTPELPECGDLTVELVEVRLAAGQSAQAVVDQAHRLSDSARVFVEVAPTHMHRVPAGVGLKVRCGGLTRELFPSTHDLGEFIRTCAEQGTPFKATAGLHRAVRHPDCSLGIYRHGFLNIVLAVVAAAEGRDPVPVLDLMDKEELVELAQAVPEATARRARELLVSYGSCSTSTPIQDLRALGLID